MIQRSRAARDGAGYAHVLLARLVADPQKLMIERYMDVEDVLMKNISCALRV